MKILGVEIKSDKYTSNAYSMYVFIDNEKKNELNRELTKTYYIEDKKERLKKVRELLKNNDDNRLGVTVTTPSISKFELIEELGFENIDTFIEQQNKSMFFNVWVEVSNKRALEIEVYINDIFNNLEKENSNYDKICYLIDQQYIEHTNIFDHYKSDVLYREQYNSLIYDILQKKINEISSFSIKELRRPVESTVRKKLAWKASKTSIGTLFGLLHKHGIIEGAKVDINRGLTDMFSNLSKETLTDNIALKENHKEAKINYDIKTKELVNEWIEYLKNK
ncbi:hypothetical protein [Tenacibaculum sp. M341]|uniref:hypothetical protein n=1 Tax=Tenacibaculum sp. M341 TaxID=2530339 RepID=UPI0010535BD4|nr:hypothetical protein [Tenacibaculum sp. M341]TCI85321.1 hypothetical protein EYW44_17255 [Tenacibaculum sp. M341]